MKRDGRVMKRGKMGIREGEHHVNQSSLSSLRQVVQVGKIICLSRVLYILVGHVNCRMK